MGPRRSTRTPAPRVMKFTISVDPSLVIITLYLVCLMELCLEVEKKIFKRNNAVSLYNLYGHAPAYEPLFQGSWNFQFMWTLHWSSLLCTSECELCLGVQKMIFFKNKSFFHFLPQNYLTLGWGVMKFTISCLLTLKMLNSKFGQDWPRSFWEEDVKGRLTKTYADP